MHRVWTHTPTNPSQLLGREPVSYKTLVLHWLGSFCYIAVSKPLFCKMFFIVRLPLRTKAPSSVHPLIRQQIDRPNVYLAKRQISNQSSFDDLNFIIANYACDIQLIPKTMIFVHSRPMVCALMDYLLSRLACVRQQGRYQKVW